MMGVPERVVNKKQLLTLWGIWAGMLWGLLMFLFICHQYDALSSPSRGIARPNFPLDFWRNILYGISILTLILTHFLRNFMFARMSSGSGPMSSKPPSPSHPRPLAGKYAIAMMVSLALSFSIGIYGVILFLHGDDFRTLYTFIGISALATFLYRPKMKELETIAIAMQTKEAPTPEL